MCVCSRVLVLPCTCSHAGGGESVIINFLDHSPFTEADSLATTRAHCSLCLSSCLPLSLPLKAEVIGRHRPAFYVSARNLNFCPTLAWGTFFMH